MTSWHIEYSTALKLLNYPDASGPRGSRLVPEGASSFRVSRDGRTYTFTIRTGFRFSDGRRVTAKNYAYAINRALDRDLRSPAFEFIGDENAVNIVGAEDVRLGRTRTASGVRARGNKLFIRLRKPDGTFLSKISMPFFQALPLSLPRDVKLIEVDGDLPSAGPVFRVQAGAEPMVVLRRNPFYAKDVDQKYQRRPSRLSRIQIRTQVSRGCELSGDPREPGRLRVFASAQCRQGARRRVRPQRPLPRAAGNCISYIALNLNNPTLPRQPAAEASGQLCDRPHGEWSSSPASTPRCRLINIYRRVSGLREHRCVPLHSEHSRKLASLPKARSRAAVRGSTTTASRLPARSGWSSCARSSRRSGSTIEPQGFRGFAIYDAVGKRNSPHAFASLAGARTTPDPVQLHQHTSRRDDQRGEQHEHRLLRHPPTTGEWTALRS